LVDGANRSRRGYRSSIDLGEIVGGREIYRLIQGRIGRNATLKAAGGSRDRDLADEIELDKP